MPYRHGTNAWSLYQEDRRSTPGSASFSWLSFSGFVQVSGERSREGDSGLVLRSIVIHPSDPGVQQAPALCDGHLVPINYLGQWGGLRGGFMSDFLAPFQDPLLNGLA